MNGYVLILGANSDVAKHTIKGYVNKGFKVGAASRNLEEIRQFIKQEEIDNRAVDILYFDACDFSTHHNFYNKLPFKPTIVIYAAGYLVDNETAMSDFKKLETMMQVHYLGAASILNIIVHDDSNKQLRRIIGLSSLSGVRGRKSNFIYGSTKAAFTTYLAGLRQLLVPRKIIVNVIVAGYIKSKMTAHLDLPKSLLLEPSYVAKFVVNAPKRFTIVPNFKWKIIYIILKLLPEQLVAKLP